MMTTASAAPAELDCVAANTDNIHTTVSDCSFFNLQVSSFGMCFLVLSSLSMYDLLAQQPLKHLVLQWELFRRMARVEQWQNAFIANNMPSLNEAMASLIELDSSYQDSFHTYMLLWSLPPANIVKKINIGIFDHSRSQAFHIGSLLAVSACRVFRSMMLRSRRNLLSLSSPADISDIPCLQRISLSVSGKVRSERANLWIHNEQL
jgi:hypothetical protein